MVINEKTKISKLIKHNPDALEAIITIADDFKKLRNPILRKLMAGRTSIAMASKIGKCTPEDFYNVLRPLGFETDENAQVEEEMIENKPLPTYLTNLPKDKIINFDVREMMAGGADPLRPIQEKVKALQTGQALNIINSFEPVPLIKLLEKQGFQSHVNHVAADQIETYFYKTDESTQLEMDDEISTSEDWDEILAQSRDRLVEIDVRHLEMPLPMITILEKLETMSPDEVLFVNHKKIPVFLLNELKDRKYQYRVKDVQEGEVYLLIFK
ncbi:MAG: DUF2249 domain-containing protein [Chitinophagales bacterium]|nr:DUF2249 domain-containing protein [Chitinophagales bacterium]